MNHLWGIIAASVHIFLLYLIQVLTCILHGRSVYLSIYQYLLGANYARSEASSYNISKPVKVNTNTTATINLGARSREFNHLAVQDVCSEATCSSVSYLSETFLIHSSMSPLDIFPRTNNSFIINYHIIAILYLPALTYNLLSSLLYFFRLSDSAKRCLQ